MPETGVAVCMQATAEMRARCEAQAARVSEHIHALQTTLADAEQTAFAAAHREDVPALRRGELPCVIGAPLATLLGVVCNPQHGSYAAARSGAALHVDGCCASMHACGSCVPLNARIVNAVRGRARVHTVPSLQPVYTVWIAVVAWGTALSALRCHLLTCGREERRRVESTCETAAPHRVALPRLPLAPPLVAGVSAAGCLRISGSVSSSSHCVISVALGSVALGSSSSP